MVTESESYSLGQLLQTENLYTFDSEKDVKRILALYFQWKDLTKCIAYHGEEYNKAEFVVDEDLADYDSFHVKTSKTFGPGNEILRARFEVFNVCFELEASIISEECFENDKYFELALPNKITVLKFRKQPRTLVEQELPVMLADGQKSTAMSFSVNVDSIAFNDSRDISKIITPGGRIALTLLNRKEKKSIYSFNAISDEEYRLSFELFMSLKYPLLSRRSNFENDKIFKLFIESGYLGQYMNIEEIKNMSGDIFDVWDNVYKQGGNTYDILAVCEGENLVGSSSLTKSFVQDGEFMWIKHSYCAIKNNRQLDNSGDLYKWRCEYIMGSPTHKDNTPAAMVLYSSKSRWCERIYTKYVSYSKQEGAIIPIHIHREHVVQSGLRTKEEPIESSQYQIGKELRTALRYPGAMLVFSSSFINLSNSLNYCSVFDPELTNEDVQAYMQETLKKHGVGEGIFLVTYPLDSKISKKECKTSTDRLVTFKKNGMQDMISSLEHSIAVTKLKYE
ncbi:MAG: hypothetical protein HYV97_01290 [Bdellovibrio sp.]|nr:hypothetical protein [Bdellovibrio sp.]